MSNRFNHHQRYIHHHRIKINTTFLPMLCSRSSIKDVAHPTHRRLSDQGLSPKVGCMGQLKSTATRASSSASASASSSSCSQSDRSFSASPNHHRPHYSKLRKIFSGKNLLASNGNNASNVKSGSSRGRGRRIVADVNQKKKQEQQRSGGSRIEVDLMDPPLPVVKKAQKAGEGESLWKRRSAVKGLQLQLQQIEVATAHHHHHQHQHQRLQFLQPTITV